MADDPVPHDPAKAHFFAIQLTRWSGVGLALLGMLVLSRRLAWPEAAGYVLLALGLAEVFVLPTVLARRWKTPFE